MAVRPSWEGHLRLSLVTCPVALYPATTEAETVRFNMINPATGNRIKMKTTDAGTGEEVSRGDLVKGFEIAKNEYVLFDKDELAAVKLESTRIIDIEKFVPVTSIDRLYWDTPYHLVPSNKTGIEAFAVIRAAMDKKGMVAIGRLVMSTRERICGIEIEENGLRLTTLRTAEEVRDIAEMPAPELPKPDAGMLAIAEQIVEQRKGDFDPGEFIDRYETALRELIEEKKRGHVVKPVAAAANDDGKVIDLMAALKRSLKAGVDDEKPVAAAERRPPARRAPTPRRAPKGRGKSAA
jgi:DNA end-binding protein Ku